MIDRSRNAAFEQGEPITRAQLCVLAGVATSRLGQLSHDRKPSAEHPLQRAGHGELTAASASAWLAARGVVGFRAEK